MKLPTKCFLHCICISIVKPVPCYNNIPNLLQDCLKSVGSNIFNLNLISFGFQKFSQHCSRRTDNIRMTFHCRSLDHECHVSHDFILQHFKQTYPSVSHHFQVCKFIVLYSVMKPILPQCEKSNQNNFLILGSFTIDLIKSICAFCYNLHAQDFWYLKGSGIKYICCRNMPFTNNQHLNHIYNAFWNYYSRGKIG